MRCIAVHDPYFLLFLYDRFIVRVCSFLLFLYDRFISFSSFPSPTFPKYCCGQFVQFIKYKTFGVKHVDLCFISNDCPVIMHSYSVVLSLHVLRLKQLHLFPHFFLFESKTPNFSKTQHGE